MGIPGPAGVGDHEHRGHVQRRQLETAQPDLLIVRERYLDEADHEVCDRQRHPERQLHGSPGAAHEQGHERRQRQGREDHEDRLLVRKGEIHVQRSEAGGDGEDRHDPDSGSLVHQPRKRDQPRGCGFAVPIPASTT